MAFRYKCLKVEIIDISGQILCEFESISKSEFSEIKFKSTVVLAPTLSGAVVDGYSFDKCLVLQNEVLPFILLHFTQAGEDALSGDFFEFQIGLMKLLFLLPVDAAEVVYEPVL